MLQKFVFQDNIYLLSRIIDTISDGIQLELSTELFARKLFNDILFTHIGLDHIFSRIEKQAHLADYHIIMQNLYSCEKKILIIIPEFSKKFGMHLTGIADPKLRLQKIYDQHCEIKKKIHNIFLEKEWSHDASSIVSQNELSKLFSL